MRNLLLGLVIASFGFAGCQPASVFHGELGFSESRRLVIVSENVRPDIALFYKKEYGMVLVLPLRALIAELTSINDTVGRWEIIVPKVGEKYFLTVLKHMPTRALSKARGMVVLIDSSGFPDMEREVRRVTDSNFFVVYEFQKDLK